MIELLSFLVALGVLITVHEYGHYRVAVANGVRVLQFSVGFGKVLWRWQSRSGTEFMICALPLGGYVRMLDEREGPIRVEDRPHALGSKSLWARSMIVAAGPVANFLLAIALFTVVHWIGTQEQKALLGTPPVGSAAERAGIHAGDLIREAAMEPDQWSPVVSMESLRWQVMKAAMDSQPLQLRVSDAQGRGLKTLTLDTVQPPQSEVDAGLMRRLGLSPLREPVVLAVPDGPAKAAGVQPGDRILKVGGAPVVDAAHLEGLIRAHNPQAGPMIWDIQRGAQGLTLQVTPVFDPDAQVVRARVQLGGPPQWVTVRYGPIDGLLQGVQDTWDQSLITLKMLGRMVIGEASVKNLSGVVSIADYAGKSARIGGVAFLGFLAVLSVGLAVLNLLPLPMLDGGHLMYYLFEALTGRPVPDAWLDRLQRFGLVLLVLVMLLALFNDVNRLLGLP